MPVVKALNPIVFPEGESTNVIKSDVVPGGIEPVEPDIWAVFCPPASPFSPGDPVEPAKEKFAVNDKYLRKPIEDIRLLKRMKWEIDSPRFREAQIICGYTDEELELKDISEFRQEEYSDK